jgi:hypothetical protein
MGYPDGYYYGQGRIICDTSTFSVGDTIRVRSMTDSSKVWNQQVATVGTALVFTVPCYDYYKICTVQDIGGVATEVGGVYKTVDYGQTLFINVLDKTTLSGIQGILNPHQEGDLLNIGDEVKISIGGNPWIMQIANINTVDHIIDFVSKEVYSKSVPTSANSVNYTTSPAPLRTIMQNIYNNIDANDKQFIKETTLCGSQDGNTTNYTIFKDYVYACDRTAVDGLVSGTPPIQRYQFALFATAANRVKQYQGSTSGWWTCDGAGSAGQWAKVNVSGNVAGDARTYQEGVVPCFRLTADS